jgi:hypothetical protein
MQPMEGSGFSTFVLTAFFSFGLFNIFRWFAAETSCGTTNEFWEVWNFDFGKYNF